MARNHGAAWRAAFAAVSRAAFLDAAQHPYVDADAPLAIGEGQTTSQPFVIALMLQALALQPGTRVLEVGVGSGYQTALLCELTAEPEQPQGHTVFAMERSPVLAARAAAVLQQLGYQPHVQVGDGAAGWPEAAPFAAIVVAAAAPHIPRPLWEQLAEGGRMVLPVGERNWEQTLQLVRKLDGRLHAKTLGGVRFVPLISPLFDDPAMWLEEV